LAEEYEALSYIYPDELESEAINLSRDTSSMRCPFTSRQGWQTAG